MVYNVERSIAARKDVKRLVDHLVQSYLDLGEAPEDALGRAVGRIQAIENSIDGLCTVPHQGTLWPEMLEGLRWTTKDRAILYFVVDDAKRSIRILAVFFSGQDHKTLMLNRLRADN